MKIDKWKLLKCILIPLAVGGLAAFFTRDAMRIYANLEQPPLSPPGWVFPIVWTILYILMGVASYLIWEAETENGEKSQALTIYAYQLGANFLWSIFFFSFQWYLFSFFWLLLLWGLILRMIKAFADISKTAAYLCIPYLIWVTFAGYLNLGVWWLNR